MSSSPGAPVRVGIGLTLYNNARYLPAALESLLNQTCRDFGLVLVDDHSSDETEGVAREYARRDRRIRYTRNEGRLGLIGSWRRAFAVVRQEFPDAPYFAWASDHDLWAPAWLETLTEALDRHPDVVLAYPATLRMSEAGRARKRSDPWRFDTTGMSDRRQRWVLMCRHLMGAGNMVYGLARADAVARAGVYRDVILPDRLLMAELTLQGQILHVPEVLWFRRELGLSSIARQRRTLFGPRRPPLLAYLPWPLVHACLLLRDGRKRDRSSLPPAADLRMCARYSYTQSLVQFRKYRSARRQRRAAAQSPAAPHQPGRRRTRRRKPEPSKQESTIVRTTVSSWLDRKVATAIVKPLSEHLRAELMAELMEARRLRKALKVIHDDVSAAMARLADKQDALLSSQEAVAASVARLSLGAEQNTDKPVARQPEAPRSGGSADETFHQLLRQVVRDGRTNLAADRLFTLWQAVRNVHGLGLAAVEVGCDRGGISYFLAGAFAALAGREVEFHAFESFDGHRPEAAERDPIHHPGISSARDFDDVCAYLAPFRQLIVHRHASPGREQLSPKTFSLVHVNTNLYDSTLNALAFFGPRLARGGVLIAAGDFDAPRPAGARDAVRTFLQSRTGYVSWDLPSEQVLLVRVDGEAPPEVVTRAG